MTAMHHSHWPEGVPHHIHVPDESIWKAFHRRALENPTGIGLHYLGREFSWRELVDEAQYLAGALAHLHVEKGDRVLLFMQNCPQYVVAFHAVLRLGAVVVPVNPMNKADELAHYIRDSGAKLAIASSDIAKELVQASQAIKPGLDHLVVFDIADALPESGATNEADWPTYWRSWLTIRHPLPQVAELDVHAWQNLIQQAQEAPELALDGVGDTLALLPYTSGTTGSPKGCMHTHQSLMHNAMGARSWLDMKEGDATLIVVPLFHITGLVMGMLASICNGCQMVVLPRWDRKVAARTIEHKRITHWPNIPTMVIDLLGGDDLSDYNLSSLRYIGGGGAPMPDAVGEQLIQVFGLQYVEGYGLTETAAPTHINPMSAPHRHCLGIPYIGTQALVVDPQTLAPLPVGEVGEIVVSGPQLFKGYWKLASETKAVFFEHQGRMFFRTGDLGRVEPDGYYYMADRLKRMINASGFKVWPAEVEALLHRHPAIKETCVIAIRDPYRGESVKALVVLKDAQRGLVSADDIIAWSREHMAVYKYPRVVDLVDDLPRTATGKVLWRKAQAAQDEIDARNAPSISPKHE